MLCPQSLLFLGRNYLLVLANEVAGLDRGLLGSAGGSLLVILGLLVLLLDVLLSLHFRVLAQEDVERAQCE